MRYGVCTGVGNAELLHCAGYDYIELSVAGDLMPDASEAEWTEKRRAIDAMPLRPEAFNSLVRTGKVVGPDADWERLRRYLDTACRRAALVGGKILVFGSGGARNIPDGYGREQAEEDLRRFLTLCADAGETHGVTVVIEPLNRAESNVINRVSDGATLARTLGRAGVRNLADTYHMEKDDEPLSAILDSADVLAHVHTADTGRAAPGTGTYDHAALSRTLRAANYDDRLSIECSWSDLPTQAEGALQHLKTAYAER